MQEFADGTLTGTPVRCLDQLSEFARIGVEEVMVSAASIPFAVFDWSMVELIAKDVIPEAHAL